LILEVHQGFSLGSGIPAHRTREPLIYLVSPKMGIALAFVELSW
jgi:hypothetical protein